MNDRVGEIAKATREKAKRIVALTSIAALGGLAAAGCGSTSNSEKDAKKEAVAKYRDALDGASPAGKFLIQYLRITEVGVLKYDGWDDGGIDDYWQFYIDNGCLQGTSYDIAGGAINARAEVSGFFSSASAEVEGTLPTAAAFALVDSNNPDRLLVRSGHASSVDLHFDGVQGSGNLKPVDQQTRKVLETYGCTSTLEIGVEEVPKTYANTSPYITEGNIARP